MRPASERAAALRYKKPHLTHQVADETEMDTDYRSQGVIYCISTCRRGMGRFVGVLKWARIRHDNKIKVELESTAPAYCRALTAHLLGDLYQLLGFKVLVPFSDEQSSSDLSSCVPEMFEMCFINGAIRLRSPWMEACSSIFEKLHRRLITV